MQQSTKSARRERRIPASRLRKFLTQVSDEITDRLGSVNVSLRGNTFVFNLDGCTINVTIDEHQKGGAL